MPEAFESLTCRDNLEDDGRHENNEGSDVIAPFAPDQHHKKDGKQGKNGDLGGFQKKELRWP